jgi:hypothetical protein
MKAYSMDLRERVLLDCPTSGPPIAAATPTASSPRRQQPPRQARTPRAADSRRRVLSHRAGAERTGPQTGRRRDVRPGRLDPQVATITAELCGLEVNSTQVNRAAALLDEELSAWRNRALGEIPYLILDARYEKIRHGGAVVSCAVLIAIGVTTEGARSILGVSVSLSEAEVHWREFLAALQDRGLHGVRYVVSDDRAGLKQAREARFAGVPWQRCQFHLAQNARHYVPSLALRSEVARDLRGVLDAG